MNRITSLAVCAAGLSFLAVQSGYADWTDFDGREYEEPAGPSFTVFAGPDAGVYGLSVDEGVWLKGWPVLGNLSISLFQNDGVHSFFSGIGMTIRLMPRGTIAPFIGAGGSFNYAWTTATGGVSPSGIPAESITQEASRGAGESYWGGHAEAGVRFCLESNIRLLEAAGRYTWSSSGADAHYWLFSISTGLGW